MSNVSETCPACGGAVFVERYSSARIAADIDLRAHFIERRLDHAPEPAERMDLTDFMHGGPGRLLSCRRCGLISREEEGEAHYEDDAYDPNLMAHLYPRYLEAFRRKEQAYRPLLRPGARVLEVGSHLGAFLQAAEEWDWRPIGLDIGESTSAFARSRGLAVRRTPIEDFRLQQEPAEGIFLWNCFEQLEDPAIILSEAHRLLAPRGLLIVRVPNAGFYRYWHRRLQGNNRQGALERLGYNNLLGFPYRRGYTIFTLLKVLGRFDFQPAAGHNSGLIALPIPDMPRWVRSEAPAVSGRRNTPAAVGGPWIEIVARREASPNPSSGSSTIPRT